MRWCTVTVTDQDGRRHSVDVQATSTFDAAHLFVVEAKKERAVGLPKPTLATVFEVVPRFPMQIALRVKSLKTSCSTESSVW
jgi:hypothetical protein